MDFANALEARVREGGMRAPAIPAIALKVQQAIAAEPTYAQLERVISGDQALVAAVLRAGNSAFYRRSGEANSLSAALSRIGIPALSQLTLAVGLGARLLRPGPLARLRRLAWHNAVVAASLAQLVAPLARLDPAALFTAALLHDIGKLVCVELIEELVRVRTDVRPRKAFEWWAIVEQHQVEIGLRLANDWSLPKMVVACIGRGHPAAPPGPHRAEVDAILAIGRITELFALHARLDAATLGRVILLEPHALRTLAAEIPKLPSLIAAFETGMPPSGAASPVVVPAPPSTPAPLSAPPPALALAGGLPVTCTAATAEVVQCVSPVPLAEDFWTELELITPNGTATLWVQVVTCKPTAQGHLIEARPVALDGKAAEHWRRATAAPAPLPDP